MRAGKAARRRREGMEIVCWSDISWGGWEGEVDGWKGRREAKLLVMGDETDGMS